MIITKDVLKEIKNHKDYVYDNNSKQWKYIGSIGVVIKNGHWLMYKAYLSWLEQGRRCNNKNDEGYKKYGKKGIKRIWDSKTCINFYINELLTRKEWHDPVMSRNNDIGNYILGNCKLLERVENAKLIKITEKMRKSARKNAKLMGLKNRKKIILININDHKDKIFFNSTRECDRYFNWYLHKTAKATRNKQLLTINNKKYRPSYVEDQNIKPTTSKDTIIK